LQLKNLKAPEFINILQDLADRLVLLIL